MKPKGLNTLTILCIGSSYSMYHTWTTIPLNYFYFGLSSFSTILFLFGLMNGSLHNLMSVAEITMAPSKDKVSFLMQSGLLIQSFI